MLHDREFEHTLFGVSILSWIFLLCEVFQVEERHFNFKSQDLLSAFEFDDSWHLRDGAGGEVSKVKFSRIFMSTLNLVHDIWRSSYRTQGLIQLSKEMRISIIELEREVKLETGCTVRASHTSDCSWRRGLLRNKCGRGSSCQPHPF